MGGSNITAASFACVIGAILGSPLGAQDQAPVVSLKQPISVVGTTCECKMCAAGLPCSCKPNRSEDIVPSCLDEPQDVDSMTNHDASPARDAAFHRDVEAASVGTGLSHVAELSHVTAVGPETGLRCVTHYATPYDTSSGGDAANPSRGLGDLLECDSPGAWLSTRGGLREVGSDIRCDRKFGKVDCRCLDLCNQQGCWLRAESLMWWTPKDSIPTLATSSPLGTPFDDVGVLGLATTTPISSDSLFGEMRGGGRLRFGRWAGCGLGFEASGWMLANDQEEQAWQSDGNPALARPFTNVDPNVPGPDAQVIGYDGILEGSLAINSSSEIYGGNAGLVKNLYRRSNACCGNSYRVDGYLGYRYFRVREGIHIAESLESVSLTGPTVLGTTMDVFDDFQTRNEFHGGNVGMSFKGQRNRWTAELVSRIALGNVDREVRITGGNTVTVPNLAPVSRPSGVLAQPTNIGVYQDSDFEILPEFQLNLGYAVNCHTKLTAGYTFLYLGDLVRPGDIIDTNVNGLQLDPDLPLEGPTSPEFAWNDSDMWLMGLTLGMELSF